SLHACGNLPAWRRGECHAGRSDGKATRIEAPSRGHGWSRPKKELRRLGEGLTPLRHGRPSRSRSTGLTWLHSSDISNKSDAKKNTQFAAAFLDGPARFVDRTTRILRERVSR